MFHKLAIEHTPLQAYGSALLFSPSRSLIRGLFRHEEPKWINIIATTGDKWGACLQTLEGHSDYVHSVVFSYNSTRLASASGDCTVRIWDAGSGECLQTLEGHSDWVHSVAFSPDSSLLASASYDHTVRLWDANSGECLQILEGHSDSVLSVAFSHNSARLASGSRDKTVKIWDASSSACLRTLEGHSDSVLSVAFSYDSTRLMSASDDRTIRIWDTGSGACLQALDGHSRSVQSVAFSRNSTLLASASSDRTVKIWDVNSGKCLQTLEGHNGSVSSVAFSHNSTQLVSASDDRTVRLWDARSGECLQTLEGHSGSVRSAAFSRNSNQLVSASDDRTIRIWDSSGGKYLQILGGHSGFIASIAFSHDSTRLVSASDDRTIRIWDTGSGVCLQALEGHSGSVRSVAFSRNSTLLVSASSDMTVKIWDVNSGKCLQTLEGHNGPVSSVAFSHNSTQLVSASDDCTVRLWDARSGECLQTLEGHSGSVRSAAFSRNSNQLVSASDDRTIKIWNVNNGKCLQTLEGHSGWVASVAFSHDSTQLASASDDSTLRIWDIGNGECLQTFNIGKALYNLSFDTTGLYLRTNIGTVAVNTTSPSLDSIEHPNPQYQDVGLSSNGAWITYDSENLIWLPPEYRPSCSAVSGKMIGIGGESGKVWMCNHQITGFEGSRSQISSADCVPSLTSGPSAATADRDFNENEEICGKEDTTIQDTDSTISLLVGVSQDDKNRIITNFSNAIATIFDGYFFMQSGHDSTRNPGKTLFETKLKRYAKAVTADTPQSNEFRRRRNAAKAIFWYRGSIVTELFKSVSEHRYQQENESRIDDWNEENTSEFKMERIRDWQSEFPAHFDAYDRYRIVNNQDFRHPNPAYELDGIETLEAMKMESEENVPAPPIPQDYETIRNYLTDHEEFTDLEKDLKRTMKHYYRDAMKELEKMLLDSNIVPAAFALKVEYQVRWKLRQFIQEQYGSGLSNISHILTITGNCHDAQMTTVGTYLSQTWPKYPDILLDRIQNCLLEPSHTKESYEGEFTASLALQSAC
jgi:WD40 repeat protein